MHKLRSKSIFVSALVAGVAGVLLFSIGHVYAQTSSNAPVMKISTGIGDVLADSKGMTLYTFKKDVTGISNCNGGCAKAWPPLMAAKNAKASGNFSVIKRKDGSMQWVSKGMPLYLFGKDKKKGDTTGNGLGNVWDAARP